VIEIFQLLCYCNVNYFDLDWCFNILTEPQNYNDVLIFHFDTDNFEFIKPIVV